MFPPYWQAFGSIDSPSASSTCCVFLPQITLIESLSEVGIIQPIGVTTLEAKVHGSSSSSSSMNCRPLTIILDKESTCLFVFAWDNTRNILKKNQILFISFHHCFPSEAAVDWLIDWLIGNNKNVKYFYLYFGCIFLWFEIWNFDCYIGTNKWCTSKTSERTAFSLGFSQARSNQLEWHEPLCVLPIFKILLFGALAL